MKSTTAMQLRLLLTCILLLGGFLPQSNNLPSAGIGRAMAQQQQQELSVEEQKQLEKEQKEKEKELEALAKEEEKAQKEKEKLEAEQQKEDKEDDQQDVETTPPLTTLPPTFRPTVRPTPLPTQAPTASPTRRNPLEEASLPEIIIDMNTAAIALGSDNTCDSFFHDFVENLLTSSRVIAPSSLNATKLDISLESRNNDNDVGDEDETATSTEFSKASEGEGSSSTTTTSNIRIHVDGTLYYYPVTKPEQNDDYNSTLKESMSHSMTVYLTLWGPSDLEHELEKCGMSNPKVTAVHVDGNTVTMPDHGDNEETPAVTAEVNSPDAANRRMMHLFATAFLGGAAAVFLLV